MANEFKHKDPGSALTQAEFIASDGTGHIFDCQATGDILYASSATVLKNLGKGAAGTILNMGGSCIPAWTASPTIGSTSWANANHAHAASNSGGTVSANAVSGTTLKSCVVTSSLTTVAALNSGSITSGFGTIDTGSSNITTTGLISGGSLDIDNVLINGTTIGHTCDTDLITLADQSVTIAGDLAVSGGCITFTGAATDIDLIDNTASALSFDASGKTGIIDIVTTNCSEGVTMSGTLGVTGAVTATAGFTAAAASTITIDADSEFIGLKLINQSDSANTCGFVSLGFDLEDTGGNAVDSGKIAVKKEASFTATAGTQDSSMEFHTSLNGTLAEKMTINSAGNVCIGGDLTVAGGCITLAGSLIFSGGDTTSLNLIDAIDATTEATIETAIDTLSNLTTTGALDAGSITSGFGTIDTGSSTITTTGLISGGSLDIDNVLINGTTIGHTCDTDLMTVGDACLTIKGAVTVGVDDTGHDVKFFGAAAGAYMLYDQSCDQLEIRGASADATTSTGKLLLTTALTNINANDVIGSINFQAPAEAGGTDATAIAAGIRAIAQATFTCAVNATDLIFYTGHSEAATEKFRFTSQGEIGIGGANYGTCGQVLTSGGAGAAASWACAGAAIRGGYSSMFETAGRFATSTCGGTVTFADNGAVIDSTSTTNRFAAVKFTSPFGENWLEHNVSITTHAQLLTIGSDGEVSIGFGALTIATSAITMTGDHFHYHLTRDCSSNTEQWSQADGTTETSEAVDAAVDSKFIYMKHTASTNVKYYSDGALESTLTGNLPDDTNLYDGVFWAGVTNKNEAQRIAYRIGMFQVEVDLDA